MLHGQKSFRGPIESQFSESGSSGCDLETMEGFREGARFSDRVGPFVRVGVQASSRCRIRVTFRHQFPALPR